MSDSPNSFELPMLQVHSDPLPMAQSMFRTMGEIVVFWSRIENGVDQDLHDMRKYPITHKIARKVPHVFAEKLKVWRKTVRVLYRSINAYQAYADGFEEAALKVAKMRNHLIHGTWSVEANEKGEYQVSNYRPKHGVLDKLWVSQSVLDNLLADTRMLDSVIMGFIVSKMIHAHHGALSLTPVPSSSLDA